MIDVKKICALTAAFASFFSVQMNLPSAKAEGRELPDLREIVEANNFIAYCDLYDNIYMDYRAEKDSCKAFYTEESGSSFYIKYNEQGDYEVVTSDYAVSSNGADGNAEYYLFRRPSDELMYRMSVAPEPRPRALLSSYIKNVDNDEYNAFFENSDNFKIENTENGVLWTIDYSGIDWLNGKDVYLLDPVDLTCREFTYFDENGREFSKWTSEFDLKDSPVPSELTYKQYTEPSDTVRVELYDSNNPDTPIGSWDTAAGSTVNIYGETVYTDAELKNKFDGKLDGSKIQRLYLQESSIKKEHTNILLVLAAITAVMLAAAYIIEKLMCIRLRKTVKNDRR